MSEPWVTYEHIHEPPPKSRVHVDRLALAVVMAGVIFGFTVTAVKEVAINTAGRLKRLKRKMRP